MAFLCHRALAILVALLLLLPGVQSHGFLVGRDGSSDSDEGNMLYNDGAGDHSIDEHDQDEESVQEPGVEDSDGDSNLEQVAVDDMAGKAGSEATEVEIDADDGSEFSQQMGSLLATLLYTGSADEAQNYVHDDAGHAGAENSMGHVGAENSADQTGVEDRGQDGSKYVDDSEHHNICVAVDVGGNQVQMIVDTGAAISIMSQPLAKHLALLSHVDRSAKGSIAGIGEARVFGALWNVPVKIGQSELPLSFYVVSMQEPVLLFGVDQLRQFKCVVDLNRNHLVFGDGHTIDVPFLPYEPAPSSEVEVQPTDTRAQRA